MTGGFLFFGLVTTRMNGTRTFVVALLLLSVASVGGVVVADAVGESEQPQEGAESPGGSMTVFAAENTSEYLGIPADAIDRTDDRTAGLDVGAAVGADAGTLESAYLGDQFEQRYRNAETDAEREAVVEDASRQLTEHVDTLVAAERTAIDRYNRGATGTRELLRALTAVGRSAEATIGALEWLETAADDLNMDAEADRAATDRARLVPMDGPVGAELSDAAAGGGDRRVHVETAGDGIVLAAIDPAGEAYVREAHDPSARDSQTPDQYDGSPLFALERIEEVYPWVTENDLGISASPIGPVHDRIYRFTVPHPHGRSRRISTAVPRTSSTRDSASVRRSAPSTVVERTQGELRLLVNTTRAGGPLGITAVDATSGETVDAAVELNGDRIGATGGDRLWTVAPRGSMNVTATRGDATVTLETTLA